jgi:hypothetical protein
VFPKSKNDDGGLTIAFGSELVAYRPQYQLQYCCGEFTRMIFPAKDEPAHPVPARTTHGMTGRGKVGKRCTGCIILVGRIPVVWV